MKDIKIYNWNEMANHSSNTNNVGDKVFFKNMSELSEDYPFTSLDALVKNGRFVRIHTDWFRLKTEDNITVVETMLCPWISFPCLNLSDAKLYESLDGFSYTISIDCSTDSKGKNDIPKKYKKYMVETDSPVLILEEEDEWDKGLDLTFVRKLKKKHRYNLKSSYAAVEKLNPQTQMVEFVSSELTQKLVDILWKRRGNPEEWHFSFTQLMICISLINAGKAVGIRVDTSKNEENKTLRGLAIFTRLRIKSEKGEETSRFIFQCFVADSINGIGTYLLTESYRHLRKVFGSGNIFDATIQPTMFEDDDNYNLYKRLFGNISHNNHSFLYSVEKVEDRDDEDIMYEGFSK